MSQRNCYRANHNFTVFVLTLTQILILASTELGLRADTKQTDTLSTVLHNAGPFIATQLNSTRQREQLSPISSERRTQ